MVAQHTWPTWAHAQGAWVGRSKRKCHIMHMHATETWCIGVEMACMDGWGAMWQCGVSTSGTHFRFRFSVSSATAAAPPPPSPAAATFAPQSIQRRQLHRDSTRRRTSVPLRRNSKAPTGQQDDSTAIAQALPHNGVRHVRLTSQTSHPNAPTSCADAATPGPCTQCGGCVGRWLRQAVQWRQHI